MKKQRNYDKKVKLTRILLSDYLLLKNFSNKAGLSMAEALHKLVTGLASKAEPVAEPIAEPIPDLRVTMPVAIRVRLQPTFATNGSKVAADRIKLGGVKYA